MRCENGVPCILGVDPGASGAIAWWFPDEPLIVTVQDVPTVNGQVDAVTLARRVEQMRPNLAVVEQVAAMPKQGVSSTFRFGTAYGLVLGTLAALKVPVQLVAPSKWKRHYGLGADKEQARALALRFWPGPEAELFARKRDHGRAEAALIARYGLRFLEPERWAHEA
jgi:hypothetical protein